jgi:hypothetical protein
MRLTILIMLLIPLLAAGFYTGEMVESTGPALQQSEGNIGFEWAFGVLAKRENKLVLVPVAHDTVLQTGDRMKMYVKLTRECYVYVVYYDSGNELHLLFPYEIRQLQSDYMKDKPYLIPKGRGWMSLDETKGKEVFFLVASAERLLDLEAKLGNYFSADPADRMVLAADVLSEIRGLRKKYTSFATLAEKPLTIGGNIRSTDTVKVDKRPDVSEIATEITADNFYSKTFTIDHQ